MSEIKVYIARDGKQREKYDDEMYIFLYLKEPVFDKQRCLFLGDGAIGLPTRSFPEIKNGTCREATITLSES